MKLRIEPLGLAYLAASACVLLLGCANGRNLDALGIPEPKGGIPEKGTMVLIQKRLYRAPLISQAETGAMAGMADGLIRPGHHHLAQCNQGLPEILRRPGFPGSALENGISHDTAMIPLNPQADLVRCVPGRVKHPEHKIAQGYALTILEPDVSVHRVSAGVFAGVFAGMSHHRHLKQSAHVIQCADMIGMAMGDNNTFGSAFLEQDL